MQDLSPMTTITTVRRARRLPLGRDCACCGQAITLARLVMEPATGLCTGCALDPTADWAARVAAARRADAARAAG